MRRVRQDDLTSRCRPPWAVEAPFRRVKGYAKLPLLAKALGAKITTTMRDAA
ncbi:MAG: hypothetical protein Q8K82_23815 [Gemmatimonadaceae bacterium]|nr:hypothetical protein [Gemmatimonadaceae bacterium]